MPDGVRMRTEIGDTKHRVFSASVLNRGAQMQRRRYCTSRIGKTVALVSQASLLAAALMAAHGLSAAHAAESPGYVSR